MGRKDEITGGGAVPPPDAPIEKSQPIQPTAHAEHLRRARENEQTLKPFAPHQTRPIPPVAQTPPVPRVQTPQPLPSPVPVDDLSSMVSAVFDEPPVPISVAPKPTAEELLVDQYEDILPALSDADRRRMPAASNSDSPARGILHNLTPPSGDKFEGIPRGGFGDPSLSEYTPLSGDELLNLIIAELDQLKARARNDLRFSMAMTYPRVRLRVSIEVEGAMEDRDNDFRIDRVHVPKANQPGSTPLDVARAMGADDGVFVLSSTRQEFDEAGQSDEPPDALRDSIGLNKPRKTVISVGGHQMFVDIVPGAALTR